MHRLATSGPASSSPTSRSGVRSGEHPEEQRGLRTLELSAVLLCAADGWAERRACAFDRSHARRGRHDSRTKRIGTSRSAGHARAALWPAAPLRSTALAAAAAPAATCFIPLPWPLDRSWVLEQAIFEALVRYEKRIEGECGVRNALCSRCGADATLRTARVRRRLRLLLAFVVPLGARVHVDQCSECGKSAFTVAVRTWERLRTATFSAAREELARSNPGPERWLDEHRARAVFGDEAGASDLAHQLAGHPHATARLYAEIALTQHWQGHHRSSEDSAAQAQVRAALDEDPLWGLRLELALEEGDLDEALACVARHGTLGDLRQGSLRRLLRLLVERGRARELSKLLGPLLRTFPHLAYGADVRRAVRYANRAVDGARPIALARLPGEHRTRNLAAAAAVLLVTLFMAAELHARFDRTVWLVSTRADEFEVAIDGVPAAPFRQRGTRRVGLPYGRHEVAISGARSARFELALAPRGPLALLDERIYVVDVAGDAILRVTPQHAEHGATSAPARIVYGLDVYAFESIAVAFGARQGANLLAAAAAGSRLELETRSALALAMEDASAGRSRSALTLLEDRIARDPEREDLDLAFAWTAADCGAREEALATLAPKLARVPLALRAHDAVRYVLAEPDAELLRADYESRHASAALAGAEGARERSSAALLRAHLCEKRAEALHWLELAREADPQDVRVLRHSADLVAGVDWRAALGFALQGLALEPHDAFLLDLRSGARLALGEAQELERELRAELELQPRDQERQGRLAELLVVTNRSTELDVFVSDAERHGGGPQRAQRLRVLALEAGGRLEELAASAFDPRDEERTRWQVLALCELGRAREFGERLGRERRVVDRWYDALAIDLCFRLVDEEARARPWRERALQRLARHSAQARVAAILLASAPATPDAIVALALGAHETSVVLLAEAQRAHGPARAALLEAAAHFHPWPGHVQRLGRRLATDS